MNSASSRLDSRSHHKDYVRAAEVLSAFSTYSAGDYHACVPSCESAFSITLNPIYPYIYSIYLKSIDLPTNLIRVPHFLSPIFRTHTDATLSNIMNSSGVIVIQTATYAFAVKMTEREFRNRCYHNHYHHDHDNVNLCSGTSSVNVRNEIGKHQL